MEELIHLDIQKLKSICGVSFVFPNPPSLTLFPPLYYGCCPVLQTWQAVNQVKHCSDKNMSLNMIHSLVFNKMYYCSNVYENITNKNVRKLPAIQNFSYRIVNGAKKYDHITPLLKSLSWLPVKDQLCYGLQMYDRSCP